MEATEKLVRRAQKGDQPAFIQLIEAHKLAMSRTALAIVHNDEDAADAIGETVLTAFSQLCTLREAKYFKTWLTRILIYNCYDILRARQRVVPMDSLPDGPQEGPDQDRALDIQRGLAMLAENDRLVLTLHYLEDLPIREIARLLGVKEGTVKTRLMRSRQRFRKIYLEQEGECV